MEAGQTVVRVRHTARADAAPLDEPAHAFGQGSLVGDRLYVCSLTEVIVYALPSFDEVGYLSLPCFNDLHHVTPHPEGNRDTVLIASTGLDLIVEASLAGERVGAWSAIAGQAPWSRFSPDVDYRRVPTTKPHRAHPNHVFACDGEIWATRFEQRDALCVTDPARRIEIGIERPHDGVRFGDALYFTTVDGRIVIVDAETLRVRRVIDLYAIDRTDRLLGWCRGICVVDEDRVVVGFSRLRRSRLQNALDWAKARLAGATGCHPSHIAMYDLKRGELCWRHVVQDAGLHTVFSIHSMARGGGHSSEG